MEIFKQKKVRLKNYVGDITTRKNCNSSSKIYLTYVKVVHYKIMADNTR